MRQLQIGSKLLSDDSPMFTIAEIGHNHQGSVDLCMQLIRVARNAGFSAVKLQKRDNRAIFTAKAFNEPYTGPNAFGPTYGLHREALEFGASEYQALKAYAQELGILFFSTAFDPNSVDFLEKLGVPAIKIASADIVNTPLLIYAAQTGIPLIVSTGTAELDDVRRAVDVVRAQNGKLAILQCTAIYPVRVNLLKLKVIETYRAEFPDLITGLSSHNAMTMDACLAYALGGRIIEKHVTLSTWMRGSDHGFSLNPERQQELISDLEITRDMLGDGEKYALPGEHQARLKMGKCLVAKTRIEDHQKIGLDDIAIKTPGTGIPPFAIDELIGRRAHHALNPDQPFPVSWLIPDRELGQ